MTALDKNIGEYLRNAFATHTAAHAYIVEAEKQNLPELLRQCAAVCLCPSHSDDGCEVCKKVADGVHQDVMFFPVGGKTRLSVSDISLLVDESYKRPVDSGDCRVFLVDATSSLAGVGADVWQNKLLKTLEEPSGECYIFLGVTDSEGLLPTVRSRCQLLKQTQLSATQVCGLLQQKGYQKSFCEIASCVSGGSVEQAESVLANPAILQAFDNAVNFATQMTSTKNSLPFVSAVLADKDNILWFLRFLTVLYRESIAYRLAENLMLLPSFVHKTKEICANYSLQAAEVCIEKINSAKKRLDDGGNVSVVADWLAAAVLEVKFRCRI